MKDFLNDFKAFAFKGNMMDLAIGMIIGAAFTALVNSVVSNLFMPIISLFTGGIDFSKIGMILLWTLGLYVASACFSLIQGFVMTGISNDVTYNLRKDI